MHTKMIRPTSFLVRATLVLLSVCTISCGKKTDSEDAKVDLKAVVPVKCATITEGNVEDLLTTTGRTVATRKEKIYAPIAGRVTTLNVVEGAFVKQGDVLAVIESKEAQAAEEGARVMLEAATTPEAKQAAELALAEAKRTMNGVKVRAGFDGIVEVRTANQGEFVSENQELLTLTDPTSVTFVADVPLKELPRLHTGMSAQLELPGLLQTKLSATMIGSKARADVQSQTAQVILRFDQPSRLPSLKTDVQGVASFQLGGRRNAMLVPKEALLRNDETDSRSIVSFGIDSLAHTISVEAGAISGEKIEVKSKQLHAGMPVIIEGAYALADSTRITVVH